MTAVLFVATLFCMSGAYAYDLDGDGISENEAISSLKYRHMPAAVGHRHAQRSIGQRHQGGNSAGGRSPRSAFANSTGYFSQQLSSATFVSHKFHLNEPAPDSKRWLSLRSILI